MSDPVFRAGGILDMSRKLILTLSADDMSFAGACAFTGDYLSVAA